MLQRLKSDNRRCMTFSDCPQWVYFAKSAYYTHIIKSLVNLYARRCNDFRRKSAAINKIYQGHGLTKCNVLRNQTVDLCHFETFQIPSVVFPSHCIHFPQPYYQPRAYTSTSASPRGYFTPRSIIYGSRWPDGNTLASDARGPGSHPGRGTLERDTCYPSGTVKCVATSKQWVATAEACACKLYQVWLCPCLYESCGWHVTLCDPITQ